MRRSYYARQHNDFRGKSRNFTETNATERLRICPFPENVKQENSIIETAQTPEENSKSVVLWSMSTNTLNGKGAAVCADKLSAAVDSDLGTMTNIFGSKHSLN